MTGVQTCAFRSDHNNIILIAERLNEFNSDDFPELFIYSIRGRSLPDFPSFNKLKANFKTDSYYPYNSLIKRCYNEYDLMPYNDRTDRILNFTGIANNLDFLESDEESIELSKNIIKRDWSNFKKV